MIDYDTELLIEVISGKEYRRQKAVFLAGRIKKANQSPGFDWDKAIEGFSRQFRMETSRIRGWVRDDYPEYPPPEFDWVKIILHFADQPYKKEEL